MAAHQEGGVVQEGVSEHAPLLLQLLLVLCDRGPMAGLFRLGLGDQQDT